MKSLHLLLAAIVASLLLATLPSAQAELKSPDTVKSALRILNQVVGHTGRLVASKDFGRVGGEHGEFTEGATMLREAIATEPAEFRSHVESALQQAVDASTALGEAGAAKDGEKLAAAHQILSEKVSAVLNLFPEDLRPKPRNREKS